MASENILLITDPNSDPDDLACMILLNSMAEQGLINLCGVVATKGKPEVRELRAKFAKAVLEVLGQKSVSVAVGGEYVRRMGYGDDSFCFIPEVKELLSHSKDIRTDTVAFMEEILHKHENITLLIISPMPDVAKFLEYNPQLFEQKIKKIVIMGGVDDVSGQPDEKSYNNAVCLPAVRQLCKFAIAKRIKMIWVPRESVYQVQVERDFYDKLEQIPHLLAQILLHSNKKLLEMLWEDIHCGRFSHFDIKRFAKVFLGNDFGGIEANEDFASVWPKIRYFNLYDAVAAMVLDKKLFEKAGYFEACPKSKNVLIARVRNADIIRQGLYSGIIGQLEKKQKEKENV